MYEAYLVSVSLPSFISTILAQRLHREGCAPHLLLLFVLSCCMFLNVLSQMLLSYNLEFFFFVPLLSSTCFNDVFLFVRDHLT